MKKYGILVTFAASLLIIGAALAILWSFWPERPLIYSDISRDNYRNVGEYVKESCLDLPNKDFKSYRDKLDFCNSYRKGNLYEEYAIYQSERSVRAAEYSLELSYSQSIIGIIGAIFSFVALISAISASAFSGWAAFQAKKSVEISALSQRPWISIVKIQLVSLMEGENQLYYRFDITLKNVGSVAAKNIQLDGWGDVWPLFQDWAFEKYKSVVLGRDMYQGYILAPNEQDIFSMVLPVDVKRQDGKLHSHGIAIAVSYKNPANGRICQTCKGLWFFNKNMKHSYFEKNLSTEDMLANTAGHMSFVS